MTPRLHRALALAATWSVCVTAAPSACATTPSTGTRKPQAVPAKAGAFARLPVQDLAREARTLEELAAYGQAADMLAALRGRVQIDADLDLAVALNRARAGEPDSAAALLWNPLLSAALNDTLPLTRRELYAWQREPLWLNGTFDGWHWYIARARVEVAASLGRWDQALDASRLAVRARPQSGSEWYLMALCLARNGDRDGAMAAARHAVLLDPALPEAFYLLGVLEWRSGRRVAAQEAFRAAIPLDSEYREPALAAMRSRLPGAPDSLPARLLVGARACGLLTSAESPKPEEFVQMESSASMLRGASAQIPDSLKTGWKHIRISPVVLLDERGHIVAHHLPWLRPGEVRDEMIGLIVRTLPEWRFKPAMRLGAPSRVWATIDLDYAP